MGLEREPLDLGENITLSPDARAGRAGVEHSKKRLTAPELRSAGPWQEPHRKVRCLQRSQPTLSEQMQRGHVKSDSAGKQLPNRRWQAHSDPRCVGVDRFSN